jgi:hypothetical protein
MNIGQVPLVALIEAFLREPFSFDEGHDLLGPAGKEAGGAIMVTPRPASNVEWAALEKLATDPNKPPFLAGMSMRWEEPVAVDFGDLRKRFGPEEDIPRLEPGEEAHYLFHLDGKDYQGSLILDVSGGSSSTKRRVKSQILRRFPPDEA